MENISVIYDRLDDDSRKNLWEALAPQLKREVFKHVVEKKILEVISVYDYTSIDRVTLYEDHPEWGFIAKKIKAWNSNVWEVCYKIMSDCEGGIRKIPTPDELILELPELEI